jgi:O-antigen ligase
MSLTSIAFALAFAACLGLALVRSPVFGLYAYVAIFYLHPVDRWWGRDLPDLRWSLLAAAVTLLATLRLGPAPDRPGWLANGGARLLLALTLWLWIQNLWALAPDEHLEVSLLFTKYLVLFYLMYRLLDTEQRVREFLVIHLLGCFYLGWLVFQASEGGRLEGVGGPGIDEANALGMQLGTAIFAAAALFFGKDRRVRVLAVVALPFLLNGVVQTESRGTFLAVVVAGLAFIWLGPRQLRLQWIGLGVLALLIGLRVAPDNYWQRMDTIFADRQELDPLDEAERGRESRLALIAAQWQMFQQHPLGTGHRGTAVLSPYFLGEENLTRGENDTGPGARSSHNTFMTALVEQGVPGAVLYLSLVLWLARSSLRAAAAARETGNRETQLLVAAIGAILVENLVAGQFTDYLKAEVLIWGMALLVGMTVLLRKAREPDPATGSVTTPVPLPKSGPPRPAGNTPAGNTHA